MSRWWAIFASCFLFFTVAAFSQTQMPEWLTSESLGTQMCQDWGKKYEGCVTESLQCDEVCGEEKSLSLSDESEWVCGEQAEANQLCCC